MTRREFALGLAAGGLAGAARAQTPPVRINLGTLAPRGSSYYQSLMTMGEQWRQQGVRLVVYPDGTQGSEADMVRLMRVGTLQAGLLTTTGLADIDPGVAVLQSYPLLFRDFAELEYVMQHMQTSLAARLAAQGFIPLYWGDGGWVRYFFKDRVMTLEQLHQCKVFLWAGLNEQQKQMRELGWHPVQMETADILQGLATGQINAVSSPPIFALVSQFEKRLPFMVNLNYAPLVGACVIRREVWEKLSSVQQDAMKRAAQACGVETTAHARAESDQAVEKMKSQGLTVYDISSEQRALWQAEADTYQKRLRGTIVPAELHDQIMSLVAEYRAGKRT